MADFKKDYKDTEVRTTHRTKVPRVTLTKVEPADDDKRTRAELLDAIEDLFQNTFQSGRKQSYDKEIDLESLRSILTMLVLSVTNNSDDTVGASQTQVNAINNNTTSAASNSASISTLDTKQQQITTDLNNVTSFPGFGTSSSTSLRGNTTTISSSQATAISDNTAKTTFPGFGTSSGKALEGDTSLLQLGTSSSTALRGDTTTISTSQANAITANTSKPDLTIKGAGTVHADNYTDTNTQLTTEQVQDVVGGMLVGTETRIGVAYDDTNGRINFVVDDMTANDNTQLSNAEVRSAVEAATDSNVFTDDDHTKLNSIEASATADQSATEIRNLIGTGNGNLVPPAGSSGQFLKHDGTFGTPSYIANTNTQLSTEQVQDIVGGMLVGTETRIGVSYDDTNGRINFVVDDMTADTNTQLSLIDSDTMSGASATNVPSAESVKSYVDTSISNVLNSPPSALDTLNELAAALGDDANFSSTVTNSIALKAPIANPSFTGTIAIPNISNVENAIAANTAKTGITSSQASAITANTAKATNVSTNLSVTQNGTSLTINSSDGTNASLPVADTNNWGVLSDELFDEIKANTAKDGITSGQSDKLTNISVSQAVDLDTMESNISTNNAKTGITSSQANAISANSSKVSMVIGTESDEALAGNTTTISTSQANAITANSAKTGISTSQASAITANTSKTGITTSQASAITANTAKTTFPGFGTSSSTALAGDTTTISTSQASAITANTAKVSQGLNTANMAMSFDVAVKAGAYTLIINVLDTSGGGKGVLKRAQITLS